MKFNELKVGDQIKFRIDANIRQGLILELTEKKAKVHSSLTSLSGCTQWIRSEQVVSKTELIAQEVPVEQPPISVSFNFTPVSCKIDYGHDYHELGCLFLNGRNSTEIDGWGFNGGPTHLKMPVAVPMDFNKKYKVTIEEIL